MSDSTRRVLAAAVLGALAGCAPRGAPVTADAPPADGRGASAATTRPADPFDTTAARPIEPRDFLERVALERGADLKLIDALMDRETAVPPFDRRPLPFRPADGRIADGVPMLDDADPFPAPVALPEREVTIRVGLGRSTYRTRTREEVLSAVQPFIDIVQREVNIRGAPDLYETADELYFALLEGRDQMVVSHVFDYLLIRSWFATLADNASVILAWAQPANPRTGELDRDFAGVRGTSIELLVAPDSPFQSPADLRGARLAVAAHVAHAPGAFLTRLLADLGQPPERPFFGSVTLRRYPKDAVIDVIKGKADAACVDQGTVAALERFYGLSGRLRTLAVSPRYNLDVLYTSLNNVATHRTQIELTQTQLTTLGKDPEGEEVLFFFDTQRWHNYRDGDLDVPQRHFGDYLRFINQTPVDLKPLLDPAAPVDARTYNRFGDE